MCASSRIAYYVSAKTPVNVYDISHSLYHESVCATTYMGSSLQPAAQLSYMHTIIYGPTHALSASKVSVVAIKCIALVWYGSGLDYVARMSGHVCR